MSESLGRFAALMSGENQLQAESLRRIDGSEKLRLHLVVVEASTDLIYYWVHRGQPRDEDDFATRCLGIRLFNGMAGALSMLLRGYYQISAAIQRDLLETSYLLDFFSIDPKQISRWRLSSAETLKRDFGPSTIRKALDARDKFTGRRGAAYDLLCQLAGHPTPISFEMLKIDDTNAHCGPFLKNGPLEATLGELAKLAIVSSTHLDVLYEAKTKTDFERKLCALEMNSRWFAEFFNAPLTRRRLPSFESI